MHSYPYKILDPIHGFIRFDALEQKLIDSMPFQRLRYIRQMGVTYFLYPGAHHTRFEHSLGVMELATRIFDVLVSKHNQIVDLKLSNEELHYWRRIVRLAALCHDMGHLPFSHTAEKKILGPKGHEMMAYTILQDQSMHFIKEALGKGALEDIAKLAIDGDVLMTLVPHVKITPLERVFANIITEDNFGADRIDYLIRDAYYTGVGYGHFDYHQLIDTMRILPKDDGWGLGIIASGIQSVESLWIARYLMYARVYKLPKSCVYTAHMQRYMGDLSFSLKLEEYLLQTDATILETMVRSSHQDAKVLLKQAEPYKALILTESKQKLIRKRQEEISKLFGTDVMLELGQEGKGSRTFLVCEDGNELISSDEYSEFLKMIPMGIKPLQIFVHIHSLEKVKSYLQDELVPLVD
jgi:HD superfamily phosphohydrolase